MAQAERDVVVSYEERVRRVVAGDDGYGNEWLIWDDYTSAHLDVEGLVAALVAAGAGDDRD